MKSGFIDKLLERINRVSPDEMQAHLARLLEERGLLENVFQALQEGVLLVDAQGTITYLNAAAAGLFGMDEHEAPGQPLGKYIKGLDWKSLVASGGSVNRDLEVSYPENRYLNFYLAPIAPVVEDSPARGYVMLVRDITRTRRMTEEKIESERLSVLTMLAAGVAHELGNPLNSLTIHFQLLDRKLKARDTRLHQELSPLLETARGELERLDFIIEEFLQAVRPSRPRVEAADLNALLREAVQFLALELKEKNHEIALELHSRLPPMEVDPGQIKQAIYNVLRNASQAMESGGKITVRSDYDNLGVVISVRDNGPGIGSEDMARLFTPYFTTKSRGHGLGLLIVRRILREHGGDIRIESREGHGTTVCLHLPFATPRVHLLAAPEGAPAPPAKPARAKRKPRRPAAGEVIDLEP